MATYSAYPDQDLLLLLNDDSEHAFGELYNRYWKKLYVDMHTLKETEPAEEIAERLACLLENDTTLRKQFLRKSTASDAWNAVGRKILISLVVVNYK